VDVAELRHLQRARDRMDREYAQPLDVPALAWEALMSSGHFSRQFRAAFGETPYGYLMTRRIERAKGMDLKLSHCFITVDDQDKALVFYRDVLGLRVVNDVSFEGMRWLTVSPPSQPEVEIGIVTANGNPDATPADREAVTSLRTKGLLSGIIFATDDCDATFEAIRASGADVLQEPIDQPYGARDCAFRDPAGNLLRFSQPQAQA
jgi:predicted enzyme related to lactoylglutathione lyase